MSNDILEMEDRPLIIDVSYYQSYLDLERAKSAGNIVLGIIMRAGLGLEKDVDFVAFDEFYDWATLIRASYWALHPEFSVIDQVTKWLEVDPDGKYYMIDFEKTNGLSAKDVANALISMSNLMLEKTGKRPWIYGGYYFITDNLVPFVTAEWLNEHKFVMAQYNDGDEIEDNVAIYLPDKMEIENVILQQTTDKAELYPGSGAVDRNRWLPGGSEEFLEFFFPEDELPGPGEDEPTQMTQIIRDMHAAMRLQVEINAESVGHMMRLQTSLDRVEAGFRTHSARQKAAALKIEDRLWAIENPLDPALPWYKKLFRKKS